MRKIIAVTILSSCISAPVFANDLSEIMSGNALQLSNIEMQQTIGAGYFYNPGVSFSAADVSNNATNIISSYHSYNYGKIKNEQFNNVHVGSARPYYGHSYATASVQNNALNFVQGGGKIYNFQGNNVSVYSH